MFINLVMTKSNFETIESHSLFVYHLYDLHKHQMILRTSVGQNRLFSNVSRKAYFNTSKNKIKKILLKKEVQSNLCTTTTLGTLNLWPLLTGCCCSEVALCYIKGKWGCKMVVVVGRWSFFGGGC